MQSNAAPPHLERVLRQYELVDRVLDYDPQADEALLNRAYVFSVNAHGTQKRASGDPYFSHPIEVAGILTELHLDAETIATAILHDTIDQFILSQHAAQMGPRAAALQQKFAFIWRARCT